MWTVVVGNLGVVYDGPNGFTARQKYVEYVKLSKSGYGRVAYEAVQLLYDDELDSEFYPCDNIVSQSATC